MDYPENDSNSVDVNLLKSYCIGDLTADLTLADEEIIADKLVKEVAKRSKLVPSLDEKYKLPDHLERFKEEFETAEKTLVKNVPVMSTLSPRTKKKLSLLPAPNAYEASRIEKYEQMAKIEGSKSLYKKSHHERGKFLIDEKFLQTAQPKTRLIPRDAPVKDNVESRSTQYYTEMEAAKNRQQIQNQKLAALFDKYNDTSHLDDSSSTGLVGNTGSGKKRRSGISGPSTGPSSGAAPQKLRRLPLADSSPLAEFLAEKQKQIQRHGGGDRWTAHSPPEVQVRGTQQAVQSRSTFGALAGDSAGASGGIVKPSVRFMAAGLASQGQRPYRVSQSTASEAKVTQPQLQKKQQQQQADKAQLFSSTAPLPQHSLQLTVLDTDCDSSSPSPTRAKPQSQQQLQTQYQLQSHRSQNLPLPYQIPQVLHRTTSEKSPSKRNQSQVSRVGADAGELINHGLLGRASSASTAASTANVPLIVEAGGAGGAREGAAAEMRVTTATLKKTAAEVAAAARRDMAATATPPAAPAAGLGTANDGPHPVSLSDASWHMDASSTPLLLQQRQQQQQHRKQESPSRSGARTSKDTRDHPKEGTLSGAELAKEYKPVIEESQNQALSVYQRYNDTYNKLEKVRAKIDDKSETEYLNLFSEKVYDEIGLDLNKEYNRIRNFKKYLMKLLFHIYTLKTRSGFHHWAAQTERIRRAKIVHATNVIRRMVNYGMYWKSERARELNRQIQQQREQQRIKDEAETQRREGKRIFNAVMRFVRSKIIRRWVKQRRMATRVQRLVRGFVSRRRAAKWKEVFTKMKFSALRIQCAYRCHFARRKVRVTRKLEYVRRWLERRAAQKQARIIHFIESGAELYIAKAYRTLVMRRRLKNMIHWHRFGCALTIQRVYRAFAVKRKFMKMLRHHRRVEKLCYDSATRIQTMVRMRLARKRLELRVQRKALEIHQRREAKLRALATASNFKPIWMVVLMYRRVRPFRYVMLERKAVLIQKRWRGMWGRKRAFLVQIWRTLEQIKAREQRRDRAIRRIQRVWRGYICRLRVFRSRELKLVTRLQTVVRMMLAKRRVKRIKQENKTASELTKPLFRLYKRYKFHQRWLKDLRVGSYVHRIQAMFRRYRTLQNLDSIVLNMRRDYERDSFLDIRINHLVAAVQLQLIRDTVGRNIGAKYKCYAGKQCLCYGPVQALFVLGAVHKGRTDSVALIANKSDAGTLGKLLHMVDGVMEKGADSSRGISSGSAFYSSNAAARKAAKKKRVLRPLGPPKMSALALLQELDDERIVLPAVQNKIKVTQLDILFSKSKTDASGGNQLTYLEFVRCMRSLALAHYGQSVELLSVGDHYTAAMQAEEAVLAKSVATKLGDPPPAAPAAPATPPSDREQQQQQQQQSHSADDRRGSHAKTHHPNHVAFADAMQEQVGSPEVTPDNPLATATVSTSADGSTTPTQSVGVVGVVTMAAQKLKSSLVAGRTAAQPPTKLSWETIKCDPVAVITQPGPQQDLLLSMVLNMLSSLRNEDWLQPVFEWLDVESRQRIGIFATRIQCLHRRWTANKLIKTLKRERALQLRLERLSRSVVKIQSTARMHLDRKRASEDAQRTIIQYRPFLSDPYWFNPITQTRSWNKPKVLRNLECYSIALPEEGLENLIKCFNCSRPAEVNCCECEDSYCRVCFDSMHCKGHRRKHIPQKIPQCAYCRFQVATKSCLSCMLIKPKKGTIQESIPEANRGFYCDTCFQHEHDRNARSLVAHQDRQKGLKNLLHHTKQAYLIDQYLHQQFSTEHHYDYLVQPCEECNWRCSSWRCEDCNQVYCNSCLVGLHSIGGAFSRHKAEVLPYYTPDMHQSFQRDINDQLFQRKMERIARQAVLDRETHEYRCAVRIQSWFRMIYYGKQGRKHMRVMRRRQRLAYRAHKRDTEQHRSTLGYQILDVFGWAPPLASDSREEAALRTLSLSKRQFAREFIWKNKEDWGYYQVSRTIPRKGVPKRGFDVGTVDELQEQARNGGYRLPGRVLVQPGKRVFRTTCDLTDILRPGEYVRIKNRLFGVTGVDPDGVRVNRFWRAGVVSAETKPEGELMFRLPMYAEEPMRSAFRRRYLLYNFGPGSVAWRGVMALHKGAQLRLMRFSMYMMKMNRKNEAEEEAEAWRVRSKSFADGARWAGSFEDDGDEMIALADMNVAQPRHEEQYRLNTKGDQFSKKRKRRKSLLSSAKEDFDFDAIDFDENEFRREDEGEDGNLRKRKGGDAARDQRKKPEKGRGKHKYSTVAAGDSDGEEGEGGTGEGAAAATGLGAMGSRLGGLLKNRAGGAGTPKKKTKKELEIEQALQEALAKARADDNSLTSSQECAGDDSTITGVGGSSREGTGGRRKKTTKASKRKFAEQPWYATREQALERKAREDKMSNTELSLEANEWKECVDIMTENVYWQNIYTNELMASKPRAVAALETLEFENSKNKRNFDEAQKRISKLEMVTKNRLLITGGRKR